MTVIRKCASCGDRTIEPLIVNGIVMCEACNDELPRKGRQEGVRQPRVDRRRLAREDGYREARGW